MICIIPPLYLENMDGFWGAVGGSWSDSGFLRERQCVQLKNFYIEVVLASLKCWANGRTV